MTNITFHISEGRFQSNAQLAEQLKKLEAAYLAMKERVGDDDLLHDAVAETIPHLAEIRQSVAGYLARVTWNMRRHPVREPSSHLRRPPHPAADEEIIQSETIDAVRTAVKLLPLRQRIVVQRHDLGNESYEEIARDMRITESAVRNLADRARAR